MEQKFSLKVEIPQKNGYSYDILIGSNLIENADDIIRRYTNAKKFLVVTNKTVYEIFKDKFCLENASFVILEDGEEYKNFESLKTILDCAVENRLERKDCIVALGGGVVGDMAGFAAATYMRGIDFVQIPTTLLAQVDSSVGGKVAINHEKGKNLIGAFYQPKVVISDISSLKTLDKRQLKTGLSEVLKYAFIEKSCMAAEDFALFDFLEKNCEKIFSLEETILATLINTCCKLKSAVVNQDETEKGVRAILNFGHTFAHAAESLTNYTFYTHGEAVALGMTAVFEMAYSMKIIDENYYQKAKQLIEKYQIMPEIAEFDKEAFYNEMFLDKKASGGKIRFVLPDGEYRVKISDDVPKETVLALDFFKG